MVPNEQGKIVVYNEVDGSVTGVELTHPHFTKLRGISLSPDDMHLAAADSDRNSVWLLDMATGQVEREISGVDQVYDVAWSPDASWIVATSSTSMKFIRTDTWSILDPTNTSIFPSAMRGVASIGFDGTVVATTSTGLRVWNVPDLAAPAPTTGPSQIQCNCLHVCLYCMPLSNKPGVLFILICTNEIKA